MSKLRKLNMMLLKKAVRVTALPAYRQIESLPPNVDIPFEIADDFGNSCLWALEGKDAPRLANERTAILPYRIE